jgi:hypothetical protein
MQKMKLTQLAAFLTFTLASAAAPADSGAEQRATLKSIIGQVEVSAEGSGRWRPARVGMAVKAGFDIRTFVESSADIEIEGGSVIKVGENTVVTLSQLLGGGASGGSNTGVKIGTGKVWGNIKKLTSAKSEFKFETPTAVASIRGTRLGINVDAEGTAVDVFEGLVQVQEKSSGKAVSVPPNGRAVVKKGGKGVSFFDIGKTPPSQKGAAPMADPFADSAKAPAKKDSTASEAPGSKKDTSASEGTGSKKDSAASAGSGPKRDSGSYDFSPPKSGATGYKDQRDATPPSAPASLTLSLSSPKENDIIHEPFIQVVGAATAGARVWVNGISVVVGPSGSFRYKAPIPDEPHEYTIAVIARLGDREASEERTVTYAPVKAAMFLDVTTPTEGLVIRQNLLHVTGKTAPRATVTVNERPAAVTSQGIFTYDLPLQERDIGDLRLEIRASNDSRELSKTVNTVIDIGSQQINTSVPSITVREQSLTATRTGKLTVCAFDRTPGDQLTIQFQNNGRIEEYSVLSGECQTINLDEGANRYTVKALDKARNVSNAVSGSLPYLPGPIVIEIREPSENPLVVDDLPPMPKNVAVSQVRIEVEVLDGIGSVPETIRYCRLVGDGQTLQMTGNNNYRYYTSIPLKLGSHTYTVQVEDLTGNIQTKRLDIVVK